MSIELTVNGQTYDGFEKGKIDGSLLFLSDKFTLHGNNIFSDFEVRAGDACELAIGGDPVITGHIDRMTPDTNGNAIIQGRDKTGDLVDCTAAGTRSFLKQTVLSIVKGICAPFGIDAAGDTGPSIAQFVLMPDETAADAILRLVSNYGMTITSDKNGNLVVIDGANFANPGIAIREGVNIDYATGVFAASNRFSQVRAIGENFESPGFSATATGDAKRARPHDYILSGEVNQSDCQLSATRVRDFTNGAACSIRATLTTLDYYPPGTRITVELPSMGINGDMLIEGVEVAFAKKVGSVTFILVPLEKYGGQKLECGFLR